MQNGQGTGGSYFENGSEQPSGVAIARRGPIKIAIRSLDQAGRGLGAVGAIRAAGRAKAIKNFLAVGLTAGRDCGERTKDGGAENCTEQCDGALHQAPSVCPRPEPAK